MWAPVETFKKWLGTSPLFVKISGEELARLQAGALAKITTVYNGISFVSVRRWGSRAGYTQNAIGQTIAGHLVTNREGLLSLLRNPLQLIGWPVGGNWGQKTIAFFAAAPLFCIRGTRIILEGSCVILENKCKGNIQIIFHEKKAGENFTRTELTKIYGWRVASSLAYLFKQMCRHVFTPLDCFQSGLNAQFYVPSAVKYVQRPPQLNRPASHAPSGPPGLSRQKSRPQQPPPLSRAATGLGASIRNLTIPPNEDFQETQLSNWHRFANGAIRYVIMPFSHLGFSTLNWALIFSLASLFLPLGSMVQFFFFGHGAAIITLGYTKQLFILASGVMAESLGVETVWVGANHVCGFCDEPTAFTDEVMKVLPPQLGMHASSQQPSSTPPHPSASQTPTLGEEKRLGPSPGLDSGGTAAPNGANSNVIIHLMKGTPLGYALPATAAAMIAQPRPSSGTYRVFSPGGGVPVPADVMAGPINAALVEGAALPLIEIKQGDMVPPAPAVSQPQPQPGNGLPIIIELAVGNASDAPTNNVVPLVLLQGTTSFFATAPLERAASRSNNESGLLDFNESEAEQFIREGAAEFRLLEERRRLEELVSDVPSGQREIAPTMNTDELMNAILAEAARIEARTQQQAGLPNAVNPPGP